MEWHVVDERDGRVEWERRDRTVRVVLRETTTGSWAVTLDALEQAPEGQAYARETLAERDDAEAQAAAWRAEYGDLNEDGNGPDED